MAGSQGQSRQLCGALDDEKILGSEFPPLSGDPLRSPQSQKFFVGLGAHGYQRETSLRCTTRPPAPDQRRCPMRKPAPEGTGERARSQKHAIWSVVEVGP